MRRISRILSLIVAATLCGELVMSCLFPASAYADVCEADRAKFCAEYQADDPIRLYCLKRKETEISPSCKSTLHTVPGTEMEFYDKCVEEVWKFCPTIRPGKGKILKCLKDNSAKLETECGKMVSSFPGQSEPPAESH